MLTGNCLAEFQKLKTGRSMIENAMLQQIHDLTWRYWQERTQEPAFLQLASGKEIGHRIADMVDEQTTALIEDSFPTKRQRKRDGSIMPRSMGDIWVLSNGIYNPVNVKAGEAGRNGQPNMVSLKKLLRAILLHQVDSYYLLIVKMRLSADIGADTYMVDILDYLDFVAFDSGPGQIMLKERQFYHFVDSGGIPAAISMDDKIQRLFGLLEDADRRLLENRARVLATIQEMRATYLANRDRPIDQAGLNLQ